MEYAKYYILTGALLLCMALNPAILKKSIFTSSILYLMVGIIVGPQGLGLIRSYQLNSHSFFEIIAEITVIISLFTVGLKIRHSLRDSRWLLPLNLATTTMIFTIAVVAFLSHQLLNFSIAEGLLLGAILAPTDPVLSSEVQLKGPEDKNHLRFSLTAEGGMNDGTAFPFIMLALAIMNANGTSWSMTDWILKDLIWAVGAGLAIGAASGFIISKLAKKVGSQKEGFYLEDFLTIGSIALSYGVAIMCHAYGFLAVFANALMIRQSERATSKKDVNVPDDVLSFNEQLERMFEVVSVLVVGVLIDFSTLSWEVFLSAITLFIFIRPVAVMTTNILFKLPMKRKLLISWFGVRGIGSIYYLFYALNHGATNPSTILNFTIWVVFFSIVIHGLSVKPLRKVLN